MPYTPVFQLLQPDKTLGERLIDKSVSASRKLMDHSMSGSLFPLTFRLESDIVSENWDGATPLNLSSTADSTATAGYGLDASAGAIQAQTLYAEGGEIGNLGIVSTLTLETGGVFRTASSGERIEIAAAAIDRIKFFTGDSFEANGAVIRASTLGVDGSTRQLTIAMFAPTTTGDTNATQISLRSESEDDSTTPPQIFASYGGGSSQVPEYKLTNNMKLMLEDGTAALPSQTYNSDSDTGTYLFATGQLGFTVGATQVWGMALASGDQSVLFANDGTADSLRYDSSAQHWKFELNSTVEMTLGLTSFDVPNVNNDFAGTGDDAVLIDNSNVLHIDTSTLEHKKDVKDYWRELAAMPLPSPIRFKSKQQYHKGVKSPLNPRWQYGYSMESLEATDEYLVSVREGKGHNYINRALMALQGAHILKLEERIAALEA